MMGAVTYPSAEVVDYVTGNFIPWRVDWSTETELVTRYHVNWTPTTIFLDMKANEHFRSYGFLPPEKFLEAMVYARAKTAFETSRYGDACELYSKMVNDFPDCEDAPKALYFRAVAHYKQTEDDLHLQHGALELMAKFPQSQWTMRSRPWLG
jgi:thioredoxin-related protein